MFEKELRIEFDSQSEVFVPGESISGSVHFHTDEVYKARAVKLIFDGRAYTNWVDEETIHRVDINGKLHTDRNLQNYSGTVIYFQHEILLWTCPNSSNELPIGKYIWPFSYQLPSDCPPSFESRHGCIRYTVTAEIDRPWRIDESKKRCITVSPVLDLNTVSEVLHPVYEESIENVGCCLFKKGYVDLMVDIPKRGFVPGETISVNIEIKNKSKIAVTEQSATIYQRARYVAFRNGETYRYDGINKMMNSLSTRETKYDRKEVAKTSRNVMVPSGTGHKMDIRITIPSVTPTINKLCPIIAVDYFLKIETDTDSTCGSTNECECDFMIGTVPINQYIPPRVYPPNPFSNNTPYSLEEKVPIVDEIPVVVPSAPPLNYEDSMFGFQDTTINEEKNDRPFAPKYPVYKTLPIYNPTFNPDFNR